MARETLLHIAGPFSRAEVAIVRRQWLLGLAVVFGAASVLAMAGCKGSAPDTGSVAPPIVRTSPPPKPPTVTESAESAKGCESCESCESCGAESAACTTAPATGGG